MRITNKLGLPDPIVRAIENDSYDRGAADISVTGLLSPPRQQALTDQHWDDIEVDASDQIFSILGQAVHSILERADSSDIAEQRLYAKFNGWTISGQMDRTVLHEGLLQDYKTASVWEAMRGVREERAQQLNLYRWLVEMNHPGLAIRKLEAIFIFRDWSKAQVARDRNYPKLQVMRHEVEVWPRMRTLEFLEERVRLHQEARETLPECTDDERWADPDIYAVKKPGAKKALKLFRDESPDVDARALAEAHALKVGAGVEFRRGDSRRCRFYCDVLPFCSQARELGVEKEEQEEEDA